MRGEQEKGGAGCDNSAGALTGHLREGPQRLAAGIAASTNKRVLRSFFFFIFRRMGEKKCFGSPHFHFFSYVSCVDLTQFLSQPNASWRTLRVPL